MIGKLERWNTVSARLIELATEQAAAERKSGKSWLNRGQRNSLLAIAQRIEKHGVIIADEVGMGKTRIAVAVTKAVAEAGGRVAIVVPPGLGYQWQDELRQGGLLQAPSLVRGMHSFMAAWGEQFTPWFNSSIVCISQNFSNWRLSSNSDYRRRALLPALYVEWRKKKTGRAPRYSSDHENLSEVERRIAQSITASVPEGANPATRFLDRLLEDFAWGGTLEGDYQKGTPLRKLLEQSVGLGFGVFDLVIIDEAHKARGATSGLSTLLENVLFAHSDARRICMTATPVELDVSQWDEPLQRIGLDIKERQRLKQIISEYAEAVRKVRRSWRGSERDRSAFKLAARAYQRELGKFIIRRDKREDEHVAKFTKTSRTSATLYRSEKEISVDLSQQSTQWKVAVCAAEALSVASRGLDDSFAKRLRLTFGSGHGITSLLDQTHKDNEQRDIADSKLPETELQSDITNDVPSRSKKRQERMRWWMDRLHEAFDGRSDALFHHPAILAATNTIESYTNNGEKVLVFGRYTAPMRALNELLNARTMIRRINQGNPWPQAKVHGSRTEMKMTESEWPAVRAAWSQLQSELGLTDLNETALNARLEKQYVKIENARERFRNNLLKSLEHGIKGHKELVHNRTIALFEDLKRRADTKAGKRDLADVARAMSDLLAVEGTIRNNLSPADLVQAFQDLMDSAMDRETSESDSAGQDEGDEAEYSKVSLLMDAILSRLKDEFGRTQSGFSRFMYGDTQPHSRRLIQQAFNRANCYPKVLIAQSTVGREGLNLHHACKTVVLLHPEWNPGVVEQQLGRVDRVGSYWTRLLDEAIEAGTLGTDLPRIEFLPIVFQGTYDEHNWAVLRTRWDDLRAQLHGVIIPDRERENQDVEGKELLDDLHGCAPTFAPRSGRNE